jgi:hypothetical protein
MKHTFVLAALAALSVLAGVPVRADNMASIAIAPATGTVTLVPRWSIGGNLAGFHFMAQDLSLTGGAANEFYSIKNSGIPAGGDISAFTFYVPGSGAATNHTDIGSKLRSNSYAALTSADPDLGYGSVQFYLIHHKTDGDYFTHIVPGSATASAVTDLKPMSGPGGPATGGASGYFGLTFAASNLGYGLNLFYYLRNDPVTGHMKFGTLSPALAGTAADQFDLGANGANALAFTGTDVGFGVNQMYFQRLDPITGFTILSTLNPTSGRASDIANLGSVYSTLTFVPGDVGFGSGQFYTTGTVNTTWQSVSFAAIADRLISAGAFTVKPTASSNLTVALTVVAGSTGAAAISGPVAGVYTVTPTAPGVITLQATQSGSAGVFEFNMLRQSFTVSGAATLAITQQPVAHSAVAGTTTTFSVAASGATTVSYQWRKGGINIAGNASATTATLSLANVQAADAGSYDVAVTNLSGTILSDATLLTVTASAPAGAPAITNSTLTAPATAGAAFSYTITASGSPTSYSATPLPAGLSIVAATGVISGTPTTAGTTSVLLGSTNANGTGNATLTITVAAAGVVVGAPVITSPPTATGTAGAPFTPYVIAATGVPTSYTATGLPAGLTLNSLTGAISGTPTVTGTFTVTINATNSAGTTTATVVMTIAGGPFSRIVNFSARAISGPGDQSLITGFVVSGNGKNVLVRGVGPSLAAYGVVNFLADPLLTLFGTTGAIASNDDWQTNSDGPTIASTATRVGAFPLTSGGKDSALLAIFDNGAHTTSMVRPNGTTGVALTEIYDTDATSTARLINVSARMNVTTGEGALIAGFVIAGNTPKQVLIRGVGPSLAAFAVSGVLADPQISVFAGATAIASNDNWEVNTTGTSAQISAASTQVGAFPLAAGSKDAVLLLTLQPGLYSVQVTGVGNTTGIALVEVYDTQ